MMRGALLTIVAICLCLTFVGAGGVYISPPLSTNINFNNYTTIINTTGNASFNQSFTDALYSPIRYGYNQSNVSSFTHIVGTWVNPTTTNGTGTGGSFVYLNGSDLGGELLFTTGLTPLGTNSLIVRVTYAQPYPTDTFVVLTPANADTALLSGASMIYVNSNTTSFSIFSGTNALSSLTVYRWNYVVVGM